MKATTSNDSLTTFDKCFLLIFLIILSMIWSYALFHPAPDADVFYYFLIYGFPGGLVTLWLLGVWGTIIYGLFSKQLINSNSTTLYRVDDENECYLEEAYKEIDEFLKETM